MKYQKVKRTGFTIPKKPDEKVWVVVEFENGTRWMPAFVDLGDIISKIGKCEDIKYPKGAGHKLVKEFINSCYGKTRFEIKELYKNKFDPNNLYNG